MEMNRQMPHDNDAEQSVLGAIFIDSSIFLNVTEILDPEDFYRQEHQKIYRAMMLLSEENAELDVVTISDKLRSMDELSNTVNPRYLGELSNVTPTSRNWQFYAEIISRQSLRRKLIAVADEIANDGFQNEVDINELLSEAEARIMGVSEGRRNDGLNR